MAAAAPVVPWAQPLQALAVNGAGLPAPVVNSPPTAADVMACRTFGQQLVAAASGRPPGPTADDMARATVVEMAVTSAYAATLAPAAAAPAWAQALIAQVAGIDGRLAGLENRFAGLENRFAGLETQLNRVDIITVKGHNRTCGDGSVTPFLDVPLPGGAPFPPNWVSLASVAVINGLSAPAITLACGPQGYALGPIEGGRPAKLAALKRHIGVANVALVYS